MQIQSGTVSVNNGSPTVIAAVGVDWSQALAPLQLGIANNWYNVIGSASFVSGQWQITLNIPYTGIDDPAAVYALQKDYEGVLGLPLFAPGDTQVLALINRTNIILAQSLAAVGIGAITPQICGDANVVATAGKVMFRQSVAITATRSLTLLAASSFADGQIITYYDTVTPSSSAFGRNITPHAGDTINGSGSAFFACEGGGTIRLVGDGMSSWAVLDGHSNILTLQDITNPGKSAYFDLTALTPGTPRKISVPDQDTNLGGGGGGTQTDYTVQSSALATPASGIVSVYVKGQRRMIRTATDLGTDMAMQHSLSETNFMIWLPLNSGTIGQTLGGIFTSAGTWSYPTPSTTNLATAMQRNAFASVVTTANQQVGIVGSDPRFFRASASPQGGFAFFCRFSLEHWTAGNRLFIGLTPNAGSAIVTVDPSGHDINFLGFILDAADTAITFGHRGATGAATKDTISGTSLSSQQGYDAYIYTLTNGTIYYRLDSVNSKTTLIESTASGSSTPAGTAMMRAVAVGGNAANAASGAAQIAVSKLTVETRY